MDYEKKYKGALARCKWLLSEGMISRIAATDMFRELMDNDSENIRKEIINIFHSLAEGKIPVDINYADIFTWLEKQGEKKPTDKVEPKFKVGNWVVNTVGDTNQVVKVLDDGYTLDDNTFISNSWTTEHYHLWTITDAKEGDVLAVTMYPEGTWIGIFKEYTGCTFSSYCFVNTEGTFKLGTYNHGNGKAIHPAIKEQRDLLFQKMKEAGYEWDAEKKELKKIEQSKLTEFEDAVKDMMDDYRDAIDANNATTEEVKERAAYMLSLIPHKPADWSEEDEKVWKELIEEVKDQLDSVPSPDCRDKEDEKALKQLTRWLVWLQFLKERYFWKPSDEQIEILDMVLTNESMDDNIARILRELREQLKKLRGE